ncbi:hypothetical protein, partial [Klebsiella variicola]|uniref:hypothetical protein n=1 Tax=Klebsiella variicola TaxID=244366 RepID=UPI0027314CB9
GCRRGHGHGSTIFGGRTGGRRVEEHKTMCMQTKEAKSGDTKGILDLLEGSDASVDEYEEEILDV